jgi:hypothetical protein
MGKSIAQMPDFQVLEAELLKAGFQIDCTEPYEIQPDLQDFFLYSGKHRPKCTFQNECDGESPPSPRWPIPLKLRPVASDFARTSSRVGFIR